MHLAPERINPQGLAGVEIDGAAGARCARASELEAEGLYADAAVCLGELWAGVGNRPDLDGLDEFVAAEVLLHAGILTGWLGSTGQVEGSQEAAKNLLTESATAFGDLGAEVKVCEAHLNLAICYWREGALGEARDFFRDVRSRIRGRDTGLEARALLGLAQVERGTGRYDEARRALLEAAPLYEALGSHMHSGRFHMQLGTVLENLGRAEKRPGYTDQALVEYAAASFHFEQAGNTNFFAMVENNLGFLFFSLGKFKEAHEHLRRSKLLFESVGDRGRAAQVEDTRARALLAEGRNEEAARVALSAVRILGSGGEQSLVVESLTTYGKALAALQIYEESESAFLRAVEVGEHSGDFEGAGVAALTLLESLGGHLGHEGMIALYLRADDLLSRSQNAEVLARLRKAAGRLLVTRPAAAISAPPPGAAEEADGGWDGFSLKEEIYSIERKHIERALRDANGLVSHAARLLGFKHHESLSSLLKTRHRDLLPARTPARSRRRSIIRAPRH